MLKVLFVCHANLCRSPMAEAIMNKLVDDARLAAHIEVDSAGTHCGLAGEAAHSRTITTLERHAIQSTSRTRQLEYDDLNAFDYVLAMDRRNLSFILRHSAGCRAEIRLLLQDAQQAGLVGRDEVSDPYPNGDYDAAYTVILAGCIAFLQHLRAKHRV